MSGSKSSNRAGADALAAQHDEPLGLTVHSMPAPGAAVSVQRSRGRWQMVMVLLVCAAPVLASYFTFYVVKPSGSGTAYSALVDPPVPMPELTGQDLQGQPQRLRALAGQWLLVVVHGAACDAACEKRLFLQRQLREMTGRERDRIDKLWLVTDDAPLAPALRVALAATPAMNILRLPREAVARWLKPATGQALEDHVYIVDPLGQWMMRAPADANPSKLRADVDRLLRASASWDKPGRQALVEQAMGTAASGTPVQPSPTRP